MARMDRSKRAVGTAVRRTKPSRAAAYLAEHDLARGRVLDYGCGFGFDADHFGWDGYKRIEQVIGDLAELGLIRVLAILRPLITDKVRRS